VYFALRFAKLLAVALLFAGSIGAVLPRAIEDRRRAAYALAGPAFGATWASGFALAWWTDRPLLSLWTVGSIALSFVSLQAVLFAVGKDGRRGAATAAFVLLPLVASLALMVFRPELGDD
jgi:hypothetical protein